MKDFPLVSICIPAYNAAKYIAETLNSVFLQTYENIEVIIVNDGSEDDTLEILNNYTSNKVIVINQENRGQCAAANRAFEQSNGDYIKFLDADDLLSANFIEDQVIALRNTSNVIASASWGRFYNNDVNTFKLSTEEVWKDMKSIEWLKTSLASGNNMMQCGLWLIPRNILLISGLWDERLNLINDFEFFIRVLLKSKEIRFVKDAILYYRSGIENSLSNQKTKKAYESAYLSISLGLEYLLNYENSNLIRKIAADIYQNLSYDLYLNHPKLYTLVTQKIKQLGGSRLPFPAGDKTRILVNIFGWKLVKFTKNLMGLK
ncbi:glycosyl transferase family 2 [Pedobacter psychrotolerans]|uniref:Glycosyl transferase n=1 Tax=Pedobacter psychrotolerans TaxID=1843235 RepID=A0A4R2HLM8_9SPHI|nr:glycosyltransferase family 2 protein [Pedobacter psychrotolerans]TCO30793.1 glycosyl transferase family 2 [Pedobacter psychrotolerans]GGE44387.1 glycosyl transferase [Pedobacter psychrotolerans]